ncbi:MAG TPA: LLM class flavin-dependent oxidoreductase [Ilumatobacteraceae bacterium]|jgi:limonene 1,2-monooxygenase|nr:LLM class flavin-dependent oxidoreductase [Ilumatobacteraceae bacterium]HRC49142.1 LLM class flavin-dependent oxidoreductase [Ilumatobacteraceae bacterium]
MSRIKFGTFLAPHHPLGESPTLQFQRDLDLAAHLDRLGYDEFWCGEHHSTGWEMIASPEMFLAAAGQRTHTIKLGTGVVSLPYHHPFNVAQRMVQLDHMTRGRAIFGSGPGALPSDARTLNIDPMTQRDRQDEALGVIVRLLRGDDRFDYECDWFTMRDAALQILPLQETMPMATASSISPSGMQLAGKYGIGALSIASTSKEGLQALPTQWSFAEEAAAANGQTVTRNDWRVLMSWHIAETREQARKEAIMGLQKWHNEYNVDVLGRPGALRVEDPNELFEQVAVGGAEGSGAAVIGTPDDLIEAILGLQEVTGGFGTVLGFANDWANNEATMRSWDLVARYVIPAVNGHLRTQRESAEYVGARKAELMASAGAAIMSKIMGHQGAAAAMATTMQQMAARNAAQENDPVFRPGGGLPTGE